jgi:uncharacterized RDD family membrane protein YckC
MTNPYAPPVAAVRDIVDPLALSVPADRGTRLGAAILDSIFFMAAVYLPLIVTAAAAGASPNASEDQVGMGVAIGFGVALIGFIVWCWFTIVYMKRNGQSLGKKVTGIKVVRSDGSPVSLARLIWMRNVLNWVISIIPLYGLIDSLFIFGESRQCLHDKIADTIVVKA